MNYVAKFEECDTLHVRYDLGNAVSIEKICSDLKEGLNGAYEVVAPKDETKCIELVKA